MEELKSLVYMIRNNKLLFVVTPLADVLLMTTIAVIVVSAMRAGL